MFVIVVSIKGLLLPVNYSNTESSQLNLGNVYPKFQAVEVGKQFYVECFSNDKIKWYFNGDNLPVNMRFNKVLDFSKASHDNTGEYTCTGTFIDELGTTEFIATAKVLVGSK